MTGFLASIKNIEEAKKICSSTIDIIDFKKVDDGALGFVGNEIITEGRKLLHNHTISVTIGNEHNPNNLKTINNINYVIKNKIEYLKIGLFDTRLIDEHKKLIRKINFHTTLPICVIFADQSFDLSLIYKIIDIGYKGMMIDTCFKNGKSSIDILSMFEIKKFINIVKTNDLICGMSGSLKLHHIADLKKLDIDFLGFRGQLCDGIPNRDMISVSQVDKVSREIKS